MIRLPKAVLEQIQGEAMRAYPSECCGVLLGSFAAGHREVRQAVACDNASTGSRQTRYAIDPRELVRIQRNARKAALEIVGFYHSHPDHPARWSPTDLAEAHWIGCSYMITRVEGGAPRETHSFLLQGQTEESKHFADEPVEVVP